MKKIITLLLFTVLSLSLAMADPDNNPAAHTRTIVTDTSNHLYGQSTNIFDANTNLLAKAINKIGITGSGGGTLITNTYQITNSGNYATTNYVNDATNNFGRSTAVNLTNENNQITGAFLGGTVQSTLVSPFDSSVGNEGDIVRSFGDGTWEWIDGSQFFDVAGAASSAAFSAGSGATARAFADLSVLAGTLADVKHLWVQGFTNLALNGTYTWTTNIAYNLPGNTGAILYSFAEYSNVSGATIHSTYQASTFLAPQLWGWGMYDPTTTRCAIGPTNSSYLPLVIGDYPFRDSSNHVTTNHGTVSFYLAAPSGTFHIGANSLVISNAPDGTTFLDDLVPLFKVSTNGIYFYQAMYGNTLSLTNSGFQPLSANLTALSSFALNKIVTNSVAGSTNVTVTITNGTLTITVPVYQAASTNLDALANNDGSRLTGIKPSGITNAPWQYGSSLLTNATTLVTSNAASFMALFQPVSSSLTQLATNNLAGMTNLNLATGLATNPLPYANLPSQVVTNVVLTTASAGFTSQTNGTLYVGTNVPASGVTSIVVVGPAAPGFIVSGSGHLQIDGYYTNAATGLLGQPGWANVTNYSNAIVGNGAILYTNMFGVGYAQIAIPDGFSFGSMAYTNSVLNSVVGTYLGDNSYFGQTLTVSASGQSTNFTGSVSLPAALAQYPLAGLTLTSPTLNNPTYAGAIPASLLSGVAPPSVVSASTLVPNAWYRVSADGLSIVLATNIPESSLMTAQVQLYPTQGTNYKVDFSLTSAFYIFATNNVYLDATNFLAGKTISLWMKQDGTGNRSITYSSAFKFSGNVTPSATTNASARDIITIVAGPEGTNCGASVIPNL